MLANTSSHELYVWHYQFTKYSGVPLSCNSMRASQSIFYYLYIGIYSINNTPTINLFNMWPWSILAIFLTLWFTCSQRTFCFNLFGFQLLGFACTWWWYSRNTSYPLNDIYVFIFIYMTNNVVRVTRSFLLFLLAMMLSVLRRYMESDYPFGIFKLFLLVEIVHVANNYRNILLFKNAFLIVIKY